MRAVDTNVIVRLLTRDNPMQVAAAEQFVEKGAWVPLLGVAEAMWGLSLVYNFGPADIARTVEMLLDHKDPTLLDSDIVAAALAIFRKRPALNFSDCLLLELARQAGHLPLGTFDRELGKVSGAEKL